MSEFINPRGETLSPTDYGVVSDYVHDPNDPEANWPWLVKQHTWTCDIGRNRGFTISCSWDASHPVGVLSQVGPIAWAEKGTCGVGPVHDIGLPTVGRYHMIVPFIPKSAGPEKTLDVSYYYGYAGERSQTENGGGGHTSLEPVDGVLSWEMSVDWDGYVLSINQAGQSIDMQQPDDFLGRTEVGIQCIQINPNPDEDPHPKLAEAGYPNVPELLKIKNFSVRLWDE